jgi:site-specific recombinase XerD
VNWEFAVSAADSQWATAVRSEMLRTSTHARYRQVLDSFVRFALAMGAAAPGEVTEALCLRFLVAPLRGGHGISRATARIRLTVLRSAFEIWVDQGTVSVNPAAAMQVGYVAAPYRPMPLTPPEATRLLMAGRLSPGDTLRPATVALALTGATHTEIAFAVVADLDLTIRLIRLGPPDQRRTCVLPSAGVVGALESRVQELHRVWRRRAESWDPLDVPLALHRPAATYPVNSVAPTVSANLSRALRQAGIYRADVRPKSIREYAANAYYARVNRVEAVAELLGLRSLDTTARLIDHEWQSRWGGVIRESDDT